MSASGWIGVDLDGTLAVYDGWKDGQIGEPVPLMLARVKKWRSDGQAVKMFTARVCSNDPEQLQLIRNWCLKHVGEALEVTATKDFAMIELWDDRCVQVIPNTGETIKP